MVRRSAFKRLPEHALLTFVGVIAPGFQDSRVAGAERLVASKGLAECF
jgi:hypothetical protein